MTRTRPHARLAAATVAALALIVPATTATTTAPASAEAAMLGPNQVTTGDHVPWGLVGPGWSVTLINQGTPGEFGITADHQLLDLVDPLGGRYQMAKSVVGAKARGYRQLAGWTSDGQVALLMIDGGTPRARAMFLDLKYGTRHVEALSPQDTAIAMGPHGSNYETRYGGRSGEPVVRLDHDGSRRTVLIHTDGRLLTSPDSKTLVASTSRFHDHRLLVLRGGSQSSITTPQKCAPVRWWKPGVVLAGCYRQSGVPRLYAAPVDGSAGHWVTADHGSGSADLGDLDARVLGGTTYLEAAGPCGVVFLAQQNPDGTATQVDVPGSTGNVYLLGTRGSRLVLQTGISCDGGSSRDAITLFDPVTDQVDPIALLPENEEYETILGFHEPRASLG